MNKSSYPYFSAEFGFRRRDHNDEGSPYRFTPISAQETQLIREALFAMEIAAWADNHDEFIADLDRRNARNDKDIRHSTALVEAFKLLRKHKNNPTTQALLSELLKHFRIEVYEPTSPTDHPSLVIVRILRDRLEERKALLESNSGPVEVSGLLPLLDAQILQLREVLQASNSWFSHSVLSDLGVQPPDHPETPVNPDWYLPPAKYEVAQCNPSRSQQESTFFAMRSRRWKMCSNTLSGSFPRQQMKRR